MSVWWWKAPFKKNFKTQLFFFFFYKSINQKSESYTFRYERKLKIICSKCTAWAMCFRIIQGTQQENTDFSTVLMKHILNL